MEAIEVLPEMKLPAETEDMTDEYAKRIAYWKEQATTMPKDSGLSSYAAYDLRRKANAVKLLQCERDIVAGIRTIGEQFLVIGKNLTEIQTEHLHLSVPMRDDSWIQSWSFEDYVARNFGFKKSTAYSLIGVYREFGTETCKLKEEYAGFGYSQLVEMLPMEYSERRKVTAGMTVKEIRELRQERAQADKAIDSAIRGIDTLLKPVNVPPVVVESVEVVEPDEKSEQVEPFQTSGKAETEITYFKNDTERKAFLDAYLTWSKWIDVPQIELAVYRVSLTDGATILAFVYTSRAILDVQREHRGRKFLLCKPGDKLCLDFYDTAPTYIVQYLSKEKVGAYWKDIKQPD